MRRSGFSKRAGGRYQPFNIFQRRGRVPAYGSYTAGYITSTGQGVASLIGRAAAAAVLSIVATSVFAVVGVGSPSGSFPGDAVMAGSSNAAFAGAAINGGAMLSPSAWAGDLLAVGSSAFEVVGSTDQPLSADFSAIGTATASLIAKSSVAVPLSSAGTGLAQFVGLALNVGQGALSSSGTAVATVVGAAKSAQPVSMLGVANAVFVGVSGSAVSMASAGSATFVGSAGGGPAVAIDTSNGTIATGAVAVADVTLTVANQANRVLVALIANDATLTVNSVAYTAGSGGAWTQLGTLSNGGRIYYIYYSVAPSTGSVTVRTTYSANLGAFDGNVILYSLYNVDQTTPVDTYTTTVAQVVSLAVNTATGNLVLVHLGANANPGALTAGTEDYSNGGNTLWRAGHNTGASSATVAYTTATVGRGMDGCNVRKA